jgi:CRP-like cAMP-binding protein
MDFDSVWRMADELRDVLPIFTLSEEERRELVSQMRARRFAEHEVVYHALDPGNDLFLVHTGELKSVMYDPDGRPVILGLVRRGEFFGILELFDDHAERRTTVIATAPTIVLQLAGPAARRVLGGNAEAMAFMFRRYADLSVRLSNAVAGRLRPDVPSRVASLLIELSRLTEPVHLDQDEIAGAVGTSRRSVNRALATFAKRGLVAIGPGAVKVLDEEGLRRELALGATEDLGQRGRTESVSFRDT